MAGTPVAVYAVDADLLVRLEAALGPPLDSYLNGWQVWLEEIDEVEGDLTLEFRLHPPVGFEQPNGLSHHDLWDEVVVPITEARADDAPPPSEFVLGTETRALADVWVLLEVFPAYGEDIIPEAVRSLAEQRLGTRPLASGRVDHGPLSGRWKREGNRFDLVAAIRSELGLDAVTGDVPG